MADRIAVMADGRVQQIASPVELYRRPSNLFVADFIGTSNLFGGTVVEGGVQVDQIGLLPGSPIDPTHNGSGHLVVRPEDTRLVAKEQGRLCGRVLETQFYGGLSTFAIEVAGHPKPVLSTAAGAVDLERDSEVFLDWDPRSAVIVSGVPR